MIPDSVSLTELNQVTCAAGLYFNQKMFPNKDMSRRERIRAPQRTPQWKLKIQKQINMYRKELSKIKQHVRTPRDQGRLKRNIDRISKNYIKDSDQLNNIARELQGKIPALAKRIKNKEQKDNTRVQNQQFGTNSRALYRTLITKPIVVERPPEKQSLEDYWRPLFENVAVHNKEAGWIGDIKEINGDKPEMQELIITTEKITRKLANFANHKKPGIDKVCNFWLKQLTALHHHYKSCFNRLLKAEEAPPPWLLEGDTSLIPKNNETRLPNKYRPICCLSTTQALYRLNSREHQ